jgi:TonB family protein
MIRGISMRILAGLAALGILIAFAASARADTRVALVIGNANYDHVVVLKNPANDANLIAARLRAVHFDVTSAIDLDKEAFDSTLRAFAAKARNADVALLYYAGHAIQVDGVNWLIPRDADIRGKDDLALYAVNVATALDMMRARSKVSIVVLDACRDNPFRAFQESAASRGVAVPGRGLARISSDGLADMLVVYSAKDGTQAQDGKGVNSPFALALANRIGERGTEFDKMFREVRGDVLASTGNAQEPYEYGSRTADFYFVPPLSTVPVTTAPPPVDPKAIELALWNSVSGSNDVGQLQSYLDQYPNGTFSGAARAKIAALNKAQPQTASPSSTQSTQQQTAMAQSPQQQVNIRSPSPTGPPHSCAYPPGPQQLGEQGTTRVSFLVTAEGTVKNPSVAISSGYPDLDSVALVCVLNWRYRPAVQDGKAIDAKWQANVVWTLTN